jgi:hypothetical protein
MHVFTHTFDYIALGILIACMLVAAAKVLPRRNSQSKRREAASRHGLNQRYL